MISKPCKSGLHCAVCRTDERQREACGFPVACPLGLDAATARARSEAAAAALNPAFVAARRAACGIGGLAATWCDELAEDGRYCEAAIDAGGEPCRRAGRMRAFLANPASRCPRGRWDLSE